MFYVFSYTPTAADTEADPHEIELHLTAGIIHQVDVLFQSGCDHQTFVTLLHGSYQVWPTNRGEKLRGDATVVSFRDFYELNPGEVILKAKVWTTLSADFKEVIIQIGLLPKHILQPMSFDELLKAASGV